jgi:hypothetical protein
MFNNGLIDEDSAIDIISYLEQQKLALGNSPSSSDKIRILTNVKSEWKDFIDDLIAEEGK